MNEHELVDFASHEADLVWSRYNAMVVADTIFIAAIAAITENTALAFAGSCVGIAVTAIWWTLTSAGWSLSHAMLDAIDPQPTGPIRVYQNWRDRVWRGRYADPIWWLAHAVVGLFYLVHAGLAVHFGAELFGSTWAIIAIGLAILLLLAGMFYLSLFRFPVGRRERPDLPMQPSA